MAKNPFGKSRPVDAPYAIYESAGGQGWTWHICKTYKLPENEAGDAYARWFVWAKSPYTYGDFEGGDTYRRDVVNLGRLVAAEPEWLAAHGKGIPIGYIPTPAEYLAKA
jgi:hypothetical protein